MVTRLNLYTGDADTEKARGPAGPRVRSLDRLPVWTVGPVKPLRYPWYPAVKATIDRVAGVLILIFAAPVILFFAALVKLTSRGPAFYTQTRLGLYGEPFTILKLRTMMDNCESLSGPRWSLPGDTRVTRLGAFLRATHFDELPQLLNVIRGDMSLIGPRPERPEFVPDLEEELPGYRQRLTVRPGVTGLAQVQLPPDSDVTSVKRKLAYDLYYIRHLGPWFELRLLACTALYALGLPYATIRGWFRLPQPEEIERQMARYVFDGAEARPTRRLAA